MGELPSDIGKFITEHINSIEQLEILLFLYKSANQESNKAWNADGVSQELQIKTAIAAEHLTALQSQGIFEADGKVPSSYWYNPSKTEINRVVAKLAATYQKNRASVINLIASQRIEKLRAFLNASRTRKDEE
jgi:hypothetical protein